MRSRSSRLFVVLLHLVGVSTNLPHNIWGNPFWQGIVGVHPMSIFLESLQLEAAGGLDGLLDKLHEAGYNPDDVLSQPFWLQDDSDGMCFGPGGFSECGDATLWLVRNRRRRDTRLDSSANSGGQAYRPVEDEAAESLRIRRIVPSFLKWIMGHGRKDEDSWGYALELIDGHSLSSRSPQTGRTKPRKMGTLTKQSLLQKQEEEGECLVISSHYDMKERQDRGSLSELEHGLELGPCSSARAWVWSINGNGVLIQNENALGRGRLQDKMAVIDPIRRLVHSSLPQLQHGRGHAGETSVHEEARPGCVWRVNASVAVSGPCHKNEADTDGRISWSPEAEALDITRRSAGTRKAETARPQIFKSPVTFSVLRYQASASSDRSSIRLDLGTKSDHVTTTAAPPETRHQGVGLNETCRYELDASEEAVINTSEVTNQAACNVSAQIRTRRGPVSGPAMHPELKPASELLFTSVSASARTSHRTKSPEKATTTSFPSHLVGASPLTLGAVASTRRSSNRAGTEETSSLFFHHNHNRNLLHRPSNERTDQFDNDSPNKPRKIPTHSYIEESKDGVWVDPDTGLEYLTDLSEYLGHDRKETGRHTLMGVGQYTRTVFKIKVYGCALYVAKRDVLADPGFVPFASLSSDQLRSSGDFYDHLMTNEGSKGSFDRTLFVKTNMQLATEVMRNSLDADWKLLTPEHKQALISSSLNPRDAVDGMLRKIQSDDNPSRCSCGQVAPDEYEADPACCARGTELVFTWRKNGELELRLDGRTMDVFPDPELARGIFYEYLRRDDPMSMQARDNFADGFPFLLAPLDQVRGVASPILSRDGEPHKKRKLPRGADKRIHRFLGSIHDVVNGHVSNAGNWVQSSAGDMRSNMLNTARSLGDSARNLSVDIERQKAMVQEHLSGILDEASRVLASRIPSLFSHLSVRGKSPTTDDSVEGTERTDKNTALTNQTSGSAIRLPRGRLLLQRKEETDEIGIIIDPTMNFSHLVFSYMVHFYLMLLLIVSVPGSYTTRLVVKRTGGSRSRNLADKEMSSKDKVFFFDEKSGLELSLRVSEPKAISTGRMKKSLSYYL